VAMRASLARSLGLDLEHHVKARNGVEGFAEDGGKLLVGSVRADKRVIEYGCATLDLVPLCRLNRPDRRYAGILGMNERRDEATVHKVEHRLGMAIAAGKVCQIGDAALQDFMELHEHCQIVGREIVGLDRGRRKPDFGLVSGLRLLSSAFFKAGLFMGVPS
jgi:hypothetical protein